MKDLVKVQTARGTGGGVADRRKPGTLDGGAAVVQPRDRRGALSCRALQDGHWRRRWDCVPQPVCTLRSRRRDFGNDLERAAGDPRSSATVVPVLAVLVQGLQHATGAAMAAGALSGLVPAFDRRAASAVLLPARDVIAAFTDGLGDVPSLRRSARPQVRPGACRGSAWAWSTISCAVSSLAGRRLSHFLL